MTREAKEDFCAYVFPGIGLRHFQMISDSNLQASYEVAKNYENSLTKR